MDEMLQSAISRWLELHTQAAEIMQIWLDEGVRFGVFCGQMVWIGDQVTQKKSHKPDDIDILVMPQDFALARSLLPKAKVSSQISLQSRSRDKYDQSCLVSEVTCQIGCDTLQFMYPHGPIYCSKSVNYNFYRWHFSQLAFDNCLVVNNEHGAISLAHPFDTIAFYGIMQRRHKDDLLKTASLLNLSAIWPERVANLYEKLRSRELGLDGRVTQFIKSAAWNSKLDELLPDAPPIPTIELLARA